MTYLYMRPGPKKGLKRIHLFQETDHTTATAKAAGMFPGGGRLFHVEEIEMSPAPAVEVAQVLAEPLAQWIRGQSSKMSIKPPNTGLAICLIDGELCRT